jgi:hypothetical protein
MSAAAPIEVARDSTLVDEGNRLQALFYAVQECMRSAISSIRSHRMRSFLTMLGVIIGVASVICIVSLLQGLTQSVMNEFQGIGGNTLSIHSHTSNEDRLIGKWNKMRPADLELVRYRVAGISNVTPMMGINLPAECATAATRGRPGDCQQPAGTSSPTILSAPGAASSPRATTNRGAAWSCWATRRAPI